MNLGLENRVLRYAFDRRVPGLVLNFLFSRPFYTSFDATDYCNLRCKGCNYEESLRLQRSDEVTLDKLAARFETMHKTFGNLVVALAEREPTIRKDLPEIIAKASRYNLVGIVTNGTLITSEKAEEYWKAGMVFASVSLPSLDDSRFREITGSRYGTDIVKDAISNLVETADGRGFVSIAATIDNKTTPDEIEAMAAYAALAGVNISFQLYSPSKPESASRNYKVENDDRFITKDTLYGVFGGSISEILMMLKKRYPIIGRNSALRNFDHFVEEGFIPFKPRALKVRTNGDIMLMPEGEAFSNLDKFSAGQVWGHYREYSEMLRKKSGWVAYNCYRCSNMTNPSTPIGDILGSLARGFRSQIKKL